jgi:hypothetical protein
MALAAVLNLFGLGRARAGTPGAVMGGSPVRELRGRIAPPRPKPTPTSSGTAEKKPEAK